MPADWLPAGESTDRLIHNSLKNRGGQIFFGSPFVDQWLNIRFGKYATTCSNRIESFVVLCIFIQTGCVCL